MRLNSRGLDAEEVSPFHLLQANQKRESYDFEIKSLAGLKVTDGRSDYDFNNVQNYSMKPIYSLIRSYPKDFIDKVKEDKEKYG